MSAQAVQASTPIRPITSVPANSPDPVTAAAHALGRKLLAFQAHRIVGEPCKGDAQARVRDMLDLASMIDWMWLEIGRENHSEFGNRVDVRDYADVCRDRIEGDACFTLCQAAEAAEDERREAHDDLAREFWRADSAEQIADICRREADLNGGPSFLQAAE